MGELLKVSIKVLKEEGLLSFIKKTIRWVLQFIPWICIVFIYKLRHHIDWFDNYFVLKQIRKTGKSVSVYKEICYGLDYAIQKQLPYAIFSKNERAYCIKPRIFNEDVMPLVEEYTCPVIYMAELEGVTVYGESDAIAVNKILICDSVALNKNEDRYDNRDSCLVKEKKSKYVMVVFETQNRKIDHAISMVRWASSNYYHFTVETISRLAYVDQYEKYREWPILIDEAVTQIPQLMELLNIVNIYRHPVLTIEKYEQIYVNDMVYMSSNMWMPHNFSIKAKQKSIDFLFSRSCVFNIRPLVLEHIRKKTLNNDKIYLSRKNCDNHRLINAKEIEELFCKYGYDIVYTEQLSLMEQASLFFNAKVIVGPTGAAFTNLIYCSRDSNVVIIAPEEHNGYCFSNLAYMLGVNCIMLQADIVKKSWADSLDVFYLSPQKCIDFIKSINHAKYEIKETSNCILI